MRKKTWKILKWDKQQEGKLWLSLDCENCGNEAYCATAGRAMIIAAKGMGFVTDGEKLPKDFMPEKIQCRKCKTIYSDFGGPDVR